MIAVRTDDKYGMGVFVDKARESLGLADVLMEKQKHSEAALSCYHAVFFMVRAVLKKSGAPVDRNSDSIPLLERLFVGKGIISESCLKDVRYVLWANGFLQEDGPDMDALVAQHVMASADRVYDELIELV